jgi:hypothetical protein
VHNTRNDPHEPEMNGTRTVITAVTTPATLPDRTQSAVGGEHMAHEHDGRPNETPGAISAPQPSGIGGLYGGLVIVVALVAVGAIALALAGRGATKQAASVSTVVVDGPATTNAAAAPVTSGITIACANPEPGGQVRATVTVSNPASTTASYLVTLGFDDANGQRVAQVTRAVTELAPDGTRTIEVGVPAPVNAKPVASCHLLGARRVVAGDTSVTTDTSGS